MTLKELITKCYECGYDNGFYEACEDYIEDKPQTLHELMDELSKMELHLTVGGY
jgi:UTP-glucose-1-phosphate uridylyltransferase